MSNLLKQHWKMASVDMAAVLHEYCLSKLLKIIYRQFFLNNVNKISVFQNNVIQITERIM